MVVLEKAVTVTNTRLHVNILHFILATTIKGYTTKSVNINPKVSNYRSDGTGRDVYIR